MSRIRAETLILHARGDRAAPYRWARELAARVPHGRLVGLDSVNHILLAHEPAWSVFRDEVVAFLAADRFITDRPAWTPEHAQGALSAREHEVLADAAAGFGNGEIASRLGLSTRTVERHLQNAYVKYGVSGKTARAAAVARYLISRSGTGTTTR